MNHDLIIEPVPGTRFVFAGQADGGNLNLSLMLMLPAWASPQLAAAWRDSIAANVTGVCSVCDAIRSVHPMRKTAAPGGRFKDYNPFPHESWCPCALDRYDDLVRSCSPDGQLPTMDITPDEVERVNAHLELIANGPTQQPTHDQETDHADTVS